MQIDVVISAENPPRLFAVGKEKPSNLARTVPLRPMIRKVLLEFVVQPLALSRKASVTSCFVTVGQTDSGIAFAHPPLFA